MASVDDIKRLVDGVLQLGPQMQNYDESTALLGNIPEFDSMAVVSVITAIEDNFGVIVEDDEMSADVFETLGTLTAFVNEKLAN